MREATRSKHDTILDMIQAVNGGLVNTAALAEKLALLFLEQEDDPVDFQRQLPLRVTDCETFWKIQGSWNIDLELPGVGPWEMTIRKRDARVLSIFHVASLAPETPTTG